MFSYPHQALAERLRMAMPDYPPFSYQQDGAFRGEGYDAFVQIMAELDLDYTIELVPHFGRVLLEIEQGNLDGFFMASPNEDRDTVALFSAPVIDTRWVWVWLAEKQDVTPAMASFQQHARVSGQMNSNIYRWLNEQGYQVVAGTNDIRGLFALLDYGRVDAIMLPEATFYAVIADSEWQEERYQRQVERELAFGIYLSKSYLAQIPDLMTQINEAIQRYRASR